MGLETESLDSASYGNNIGYFVGIEEIKRHVEEYEQILFERLKPYSEADSSIALDKINLGYGAMNTFSCSTPLVFVAEDNQSAKMLSTQYGNHAVGRPDGSGDVYMTFGLVYADFLKEDGQWKIWHLIDCHDWSLPAGQNACDLPMRPTAAEDPVIAEFGHPTIERTLYDPLFGWEYVYFDMPKEYYSYDERFGYGPKGNMGLKYFERPGGIRE